MRTFRCPLPLATRAATVPQYPIKDIIIYSIAATGRHDGHRYGKADLGAQKVPSSRQKRKRAAW